MDELYRLLDEWLQQGNVLLGIDGRCASGKTTLGDLLAKHYDAALIHLDDFFLRPEQRTAERYAQPGGNVDYERFLAEVLLPYKEGKEIVYRPFDCQTFTLAEEARVPRKALTIVEGSYAFTPAPRDHYDHRVFLDIAPELQKKRLQARDPKKWEMFRDRWIPLEEAYIEACEPQLQADIVLYASGSI